MNTNDAEFEVINAGIDRLLAELAKRDICQHCVAVGMMWRGAQKSKAMVGAAGTTEVLRKITAALGADSDGVRH
jgi:hypothetical protein